MREKKFRLAIVGGGISGLTFAIALARNAPDINVEIYEAAAAFSEVGAGIGMWPRIWEIMVALGLSESLRFRTGSQLQAGKMFYRKSDQAKGVLYASSHVDFEPYHRADFLQTLLDHVPPNYCTHFAKRLVSYDDQVSEESGDHLVTMHFADGTSVPCDVLIGADGIASIVRRTMYQSFALRASARGAPQEEVERLRKGCRASWTGQRCWRSLISREQLKNIDPEHPNLAASAIMYTGHHRLLVTYPVSHGRLLNVAAYVSEPEKVGTIYEGSWRCEGSQSELRERFKDFEPAAQAVVSLMKQPSVWAVHTVDNLSTFVSGHVALLGDAAHAMQPHQASGAGQGIEDAMVLASLLASPMTTRKNIGSVLKIYDTVRRPFSQNIQRLSCEHGRITYFEVRPPRGIDNLRDTSMSDIARDTAKERATESHDVTLDRPDLTWMKNELEDILRWTWEGHVKEQQDRAMAILKLSSDA